MLIHLKNLYMNWHSRSKQTKLLKNDPVTIYIFYPSPGEKLRIQNRTAAIERWRIKCLKQTIKHQNHADGGCFLLTFNKCHFIFLIHFHNKNMKTWHPYLPAKRLFSQKSSTVDLRLGSKYAYVSSVNNCHHIYCIYLNSSWKISNKAIPFQNQPCWKYDKCFTEKSTVNESTTYT